MSYNVIKSEDLTFPKIKEKINKAGNLFYQYRACRRDAATIYDIENIRHGVVYARTPLQMNDPCFLFSGLFTKFSLQSAHTDAILKLIIIRRCCYVFSKRYLLEKG